MTSNLDPPIDPDSEPFAESTGRPSKPTWNALDRAAFWLATGLGLGLSPKAPGTCGALWGLPLSWLLYRFCGDLSILLLLIGALFLVGVPICQRAAELIGRKDPGAVVWDEIASMPCVYLTLPAAAVMRWDVLVAGFLLHRIFDVTKPPPVRWFEKLPGGWGIMADDLVAALYASLCLWALVHWNPW